MAILHDDNSITVYRDTNRKRDVYVDKDSVTRLSVFWDKWIRSGETITSTWQTEPETDGRVSITSEDTSGTGVECYITPITNRYDERYTIKNSVVSSGGETSSVSIRVHVTPT